RSSSESNLPIRIRRLSTASLISSGRMIVLRLRLLLSTSAPARVLSADSILNPVPSIIAERTSKVSPPRSAWNMICTKPSSSARYFDAGPICHAQAGLTQRGRVFLPPSRIESEWIRRPKRKAVACIMVQTDDPQDDGGHERLQLSLPLIIIIVQLVTGPFQMR